MEPTERARTEDGAARRRMSSGIVAAGVAFGLTLAGLGVAAAQTSGTEDSTETTAPAAPADTPTTQATPGTTADPAPPAAPAPSLGTPAQPPVRVAETPLTGDVAEKVKAAALAAVPGGTIVRVETDSDGSPYEAHVRKADGTEVVVKVGADFAVTGIEEGHGPGRPHGPGGPGQTPLTGEAATKATAAAQAAVPGGTVLRVEGNPDGTGYHAHVRKADGTEVVVRMDADFTVTSVDTMPAGMGPGGHRGPGFGDGATPPTTTA